jgi:hypothetical protein
MVPVLAMADDKLIAVIVIVGGLSLGLAGIVAGVVKSVVRARMAETSRREIAAYIAEGSITPEEGERLLTASPKERKGGCC